MAQNPKNFQTLEDLTQALEDAELGLDNPGFCLACGESANDCEPDAQKYVCECCGEAEVYGAQEILLMGAYREA